MEFFLLFIFNIFTGAVIYLILSLKIERTSSTYQEQKLRKEMGEVITEFNATAERNITLLENRITVLKKLLNGNGNLKEIDFVIEDGDIKQKNKTGININGSITQKKSDKSDETSKEVDTKNSVEKNDNSILVGFIDKISHINREVKHSDDEEDKKRAKKAGLQKVDFLVDSDIYLPETDDIKNNDYSDVREAFKQKGEEDLSILFSTTTDKYSLITDLYNKGYSIDDISRHSGLPSGEVRLVISLNS